MQPPWDFGVLSTRRAGPAGIDMAAENKYWGPIMGREVSSVLGFCGRSHAENGVYDRIRPEAIGGIGHFVGPFIGLNVCNRPVSDVQ